MPDKTKKQKRITFRLTHGEQRKVSQLARRLGVSEGEVIRRAIAQLKESAA